MGGSRRQGSCEGDGLRGRRAVQGAWQHLEQRDLDDGGRASSLPSEPALAAPRRTGPGLGSGRFTKKGGHEECMLLTGEDRGLAGEA